MVVSETQLQTYFFKGCLIPISKETALQQQGLIPHPFFSQGITLEKFSN